MVSDRPVGPATRGWPTAVTTIVFYALYRWLRNHFDKQRGLNELELVQKQLGVVKDELVKDGVPLDKANKIVAAMLKAVQTKGINDTLLQSALALLAKPERGASNP